MWNSSEFNYFSACEQQAQAEFRGRRDRWLAPLVRGCLRLGIRAELVSALAMAMLIPVGVGLAISPGPGSLLLVVAGLALHVGLDGLDGPIARAAGTAGPAGAFTDMCLDHVGFLVVASLCAFYGQMDGAAACVYVSTYTLAVVLVVVLNLLHRPLRVVVRTKYVFYLLVCAQLWRGGDWLTPAATVFSVVHGLSALAGFFAVRKALLETQPPRP